MTREQLKQALVDAKKRQASAWAELQAMEINPCGKHRHYEDVRDEWKQACKDVYQHRKALETAIATANA